MSVIEAVPERAAESLPSQQEAVARGGRPAPAHARMLDSRVLDWTEKLVVLALYCWLVARIVIGYVNSPIPANLLLLPSEGLAVVFLLLRRGTHEISRSPVEWLLAMGATCAPLFVIPGGAAPLISPGVAAVALLMGLFLQVHAKIALGRSFGCVPAHRGLKLQGPYRFVRHPMYAGYLLSHTAFLIVNPSQWNIAVYAVSYILQVPRLLAEERILSRDPEYQLYTRSVRYRLIPRVF